MIVPTILVTRRDGCEVLINVSDFDESLHSVVAPDAGDQGSSEAHNLAESGSSPEPATTPDEEPAEAEESAPRKRGRPRKER
jgi:hypothetical protein